MAYVGSEVILHKFAVFLAANHVKHESEVGDARGLEGDNAIELSGEGAGEGSPVLFSFSLGEHL